MAQIEFSFNFFDGEVLQSVEKKGNGPFPETVMIDFKSGKRLTLSSTNELESYFIVPFQTWDVHDQKIESFIIGPRRTESNRNRTKYRRWLPLRFKTENGVDFEILHVTKSNENVETLKFAISTSLHSISAPQLTC